MSSEALPCIICDCSLRNVTDDSDNQPNDGIAFSTEGHYGSTVFDPMDGTALEVNICDVCIVNAAKRGRVLWNRRWKPVLLDSEPLPTMIGREWVHRPMAPWNPDAKPQDPEAAEAADQQESVYVSLDEVGTDLSSRIEWHHDWRAIVASERTQRERRAASTDE